MTKTTMRFEDIGLGAIFSFEHTFEPEQEALFATLTKDTSTLPIARVKEGAGTGNLVHGMLAASLFSTLLDMHCPGPECLYLTQSLRFRNPLSFGDKVVVRGTVTDKSETTGIITIKTEILLGEAIAIEGEAQVKLLD